MRLLLDTNAFIRWRDASPDMPAKIADKLRDPNNDIVVSIASLWEIAIKRAIGKLRFLEDFETVIAEEQFVLLPIGYPHLRALDSLPLHHRDPFDRLLIAQAIAEDIPVVTDESAFGLYQVKTVW